MLLGDIGDEPSSLPTVDITPPVKDRWAVNRRFEQVGERGDRAVRQIGDAETEPVEHHRDLAVSFFKPVKLPLIPLRDGGTIKGILLL